MPWLTEDIRLLKSIATNPTETNSKFFPISFASGLTILYPSLLPELNLTAATACELTASDINNIKANLIIADSYQMATISLVDLTDVCLEGF